MIPENFRNDMKERITHVRDSFEENDSLDRISISIKAHRLMKQLLEENPIIERFLQETDSVEDFRNRIRKWVLSSVENNRIVHQIYRDNANISGVYHKLNWQDIAAIRLLDYLDHAGNSYVDLNLHGSKVKNTPFKFIYLAFKDGTGGASPAFFKDMIELFRQFMGTKMRIMPSKKRIMDWMNRYPSGLHPAIVNMRLKNRERIINIILDRIDKGLFFHPKYIFENGMSYQAKFEKVLDWWNDWQFHLSFAIRSSNLLNEMLDNSLDSSTMSILRDAEHKGIPIFVNPYYLSLLNVKAPDFAIGADMAIRSYIFYTNHLINEFGRIVAWEKEDIVRPDQPNVAGWLLPDYHNVHRRYPEVAILIPDTIGRACGGLCASCQRMYDFQSGHLNFEMDELLPKETWPTKLKRLLKYFETDSQIRDILITGGDALMSRDISLKLIFDAIFEMAEQKKNANRNRKNGEKYAEILRIRLGTRLPVYLPQRITPKLIEILSDFQKRASTIGIRQFFIQTHFESAMEVTPESKEAIRKLISAGWHVTNQQVFTASTSRRGHTIKLRKILNDIGVLPYYTFTVKGYMENYDNFVNNARIVQEQQEEKVYGKLPDDVVKSLGKFLNDPAGIHKSLNELRTSFDLPFITTDRNVLNLPGVGKSMTFRVIGITHDGRRILKFDYDHTRNHSPIIEQIGKVTIIESKSISDYLNQLDEMGENLNEYENIYGYSLGETEIRIPIYDYPSYDFEVTPHYTNLCLSQDSIN
jgi:lysine 2,3-aminomutase